MPVQILIKKLLWVQDEVIYLTECGLKEIHAIQSATINNANVIGIEQQYGSIEKGKIANLLVLNSNPLDHIINIKDVYMVFKKGNLISE